MTKKRNFKKLFYFLLTLFLLAVLVIGGRGILPAFADTANYTSVLTDLQKDKKFDLRDYPDNSKDYSIKIIQIAEGVDGELFLYTYQPCQKTRYLVATSISMTLSKDFEDIPDYGIDHGFSGPTMGGGSGGWGGSSGGGGGGGGSQGCSLLSVGTDDYLYDLILLSSDGVFCKYRVSDFVVSEDETRYYNITSIYRKWDIKIDKDAGNDGTISEVAYTVGQVWTVTNVSDSVKYELKEVETIKVLTEMIGMRRYSDGFQFDGTKSCDAHYMAFTCDHDIDKLLSADISFYTTYYTAYNGETRSVGEPIPHTVTLHDYQVASNDGGGWFGDKREWHRMTSTKEFIKELSISGEERDVLLKYDWILSFYETEYICAAGGKDVLISGLIPFGFIWTIINSLTTEGEIVSDVTLLRLEFDYEGQIYNLGVVSNKQTGTNEPTNGGFNLYVWLADKLGVPVWAAKLILWAIILLPLFCILLPVLSVVFPPFGAVVKAVFKGIWWVVCLPFKGIKALIHKIRGE